MEIPADNPMTEEGIALGRRLFYDPIMSLDSTISCGSCHMPNNGMTDGLALSTGVDGAIGRRSSMMLFNIGYAYNGLFWDGRSPNLEDQALHPIEDINEMKESWPNVIGKLQNHNDYPRRFREAFGISDRDEITKELAAKALAQFQRTLISGNSRYDKNVIRGEGFPEDDEVNGQLMYFFETQGGAASGLEDAECAHCHNGFLLTSNQYFNNGLDEVASLNDFEDLGQGAVTGQTIDNGKFRAPSLRNIALTAPYMHDGRFNTLEEVIDHYDSGGHVAANLDPNMRVLGLTEDEKAYLLAFLNSFTDMEAITNPDFQNPF